MEYKDKEFEARFALKRGVYQKLEEMEKAISAMYECFDRYSGSFFERGDFENADTGFLADIARKLTSIDIYARWTSSETEGLMKEARRQTQWMKKVS